METENDGFQCLVDGCGKHFKRKEHLIRHGASHSPVKPYICITCNKSFTRSDVLSRHVRQHGVDAPKSSIISVLNACDGCHLTKKKCSGGSPCKFCQDHGLECTRNRLVTRHRATKESQENLVASLGVMTDLDGSTTADAQLFEDPTLADAPILNSISSSILINFDGTTTVQSPFDKLPFSLPIDFVGTPLFGQSSLGSVRSLTNLLRGFFHPLSFQASPYSCALDKPMLDSLIVAYFAHLYQRWPMVYPKSFTKTEAHPFLLWTILMAGARCLPEQPGALELTNLLRDVLFPILGDEMGTWLQEPTSNSAPLLPILQAATIYVVYSFCFGDEDQLLLGNSLNDLIIKTLLSIGAYDTEVWTKEIPWADPMSEDWVRTEIRKRLTSMSFLNHIYLCILLARPPTFDYRNLNCRLPCRNSWFWAMSQKDILDLRLSEPQDRSPKSMAMFINDTLGEDKMNADVDFRTLEVVDCHLIQIAMHALIWNEKSRGESISDARQLYWESNLEFWKSRMEREYWIRQHADVSPEKPSCRTQLESVNFTLHHFSSMHLHSDISLFTEYARLLTQQQQCHQARADIKSDISNLSSRIITWSSTVLARQSAYSAGQILAQFHHLGDSFTLTFNSILSPSSRPLTLEPLPKLALFDASLLIWAFCLHRRSCPTCRTAPISTTNQPPEKGTFELTFPYDSEFVNRWLSTDGRILLDETILCRCRIGDLMSQFEKILKAFADKNIDDGFLARKVNFLENLRQASMQLVLRNGSVVPTGPFLK